MPPAPTGPRCRKRKFPVSVDSTDRLDLEPPEVLQDLRPPEPHRPRTGDPDETDAPPAPHPLDLMDGHPEALCEALGIEEVLGIFGRGGAHGCALPGDMSQKRDHYFGLTEKNPWEKTTGLSQLAVGHVPKEMQELVDMDSRYGFAFRRMVTAVKELSITPDQIDRMFPQPPPRSPETR